MSVRLQPARNCCGCSELAARPQCSLAQRETYPLSDHPLGLVRSSSANVGRNQQGNFLIIRARSGAFMKLNIIRCGLALLFAPVGAGVCHADCAALYALAQRHAHDMARRNSLDHAGFMRHRGPAGGRRRERCGWMRDRGVCEADVDAVAAAPRQHDAWRVPSRWVRGVGKRPPLLGNGDRRRSWGRRKPRLFRRRR
jgi:hypothetical protein